MDNPGLKHIPPFLKVTHRRTATSSPVLPAPKTIDGGGYGVPPEPPTLKEKVTEGPPMAGNTPRPGVSATNGAAPIVAYKPITATPPQPDPNKNADQRRIEQQKQRGSNENPTYDRAQQAIQNRIQQRRAHPLHQARKAEEWPDSYDLMAHEHELGPDPLADSVLNPEGQVHSPWHTPDVYVPPIRHIDPRSPQYDADYNKGWEASDSYGTGDWDDPDNSALDRMDDSNASHAAYDGYMDRAVGREKHHYRAVRRLGLDNPEDLPDEYWDHPEKVASAPAADPMCETCYLRHGIEGMTEKHHTQENLGKAWDGHEFKPLKMEPGQRFSRTAETDEEFWARQQDVVDRDPRVNEGPGCETCWLNEGDPNAHEGLHVGDFGGGHQFKPFGEAPSQRFSAVKNPGLILSDRVDLIRTAETDEEFWARQPDVIRHMHSPDASSQEFPEDDYRDPDIDWDSDDMDIPENMSLRDHAHLLRSGIVNWDGDTRYPQYTHRVSREIRDSDGQRGFADEGHVIEHNTSHRGPVLPTPDNPEPHPLSYPWTHTYYPAGLPDSEGLVKGYNSPDAALGAVAHLSVWGNRHPTSQDILNSGYRYVGSELPHDPSVELPAEKAMRMGREAAYNPARGEFEYHIDVPGYHEFDAPPSRGSWSAQHAVKVKDDSPYLEDPEETEEGYMVQEPVLNQPQRHREPVCKNCFDLGISLDHPPGSSHEIHDVYQPGHFLHPYQPMEETSPGERL